MRSASYPNPLLTFPGWVEPVKRAEEARVLQIHRTEGAWRISENHRSELFRIGQMETNLKRKTA